MPGVIVALDTPSSAEAVGLVERLGEACDFYKVGLELYTSAGPSIVSDLRARDKRVFLDLKLHDIPATVAGAVRAASMLRVEMLTVHAGGGRAMLERALEAARDEVRVLAVTVLTSLDRSDLGSVWAREVESESSEARRLAELAVSWGAHGVVASAAEAASIREGVGGEALLVTPGIRPGGADRHDQKRVATAADAVRAGADYLVVGRPVTRSEQPESALAAILAEVDEAESALA